MAKRKKRILPPYRNYEANQEKILDAYKKLADEEGIVLPSYEQLAKRAGVSLSTVKRHFSELNFDYICKRERLHTPEVVKAIRDSALDGKARAQKLYAQIMEGYIEKKEQKSEVVGDLNVNADISGELKVNIQRGIIRSKEDLQALQDIANVVNKTSQGQSQGETDQAADTLIKENTPAFIQNVDTMVFFK